jgi:hypothetical protein
MYRHVGHEANHVPATAPSTIAGQVPSYFTFDFNSTPKRRQRERSLESGLATRVRFNFFILFNINASVIIIRIVLFPLKTTDSNDIWFTYASRLQSPCRCISTNLLLTRSDIHNEYHCSDLGAVAPNPSWVVSNNTVLWQIFQSAIGMGPADASRDGEAFQ